MNENSFKNHTDEQFRTILSDIRKNIEDGIAVSKEQIDALLQELNTEAREEALYDLAHEVTRSQANTHFDMCSIINAKSGRCSEDCKWCAQSAHFGTNAEIYGLLPEEVIVEHGCYNEKKGVGRFSLVTSGKRPSDREVEAICQRVKKLKEKSNIRICASLGLASREQLDRLFEAGVERYHCNLETAPSHFGNLCTTHTQEDKLQTLNAAIDSGMDICSGGIIGMGETEEQRIELAFTLRQLNTQSIPINILHPIPGTPLGETPLLGSREILRTVALYRLIHPSAYLRLSGGRARLDEETMQKLLYVGINAAIVGDLLTTIGSKIDEDKKRFLNAGYTL